MTMMTKPQSAPTPPELARAPECAALSILDHASFAAGFALLAVNPAAADAEFDRQLDRREILADVILKHICALQSALRRYRDVAVGTERYVRDDPF
jgi:hypothetical protein